MTNPQYIDNATFVGAPPGTTVTQLTPGTPGVDFTSTNASVTIPFLPGVTPIIVSVSVPNTDTNVDQITVIVTAPNGTVVVNEVSPTDTNTVTNFPVTPLPENSTVTIIIRTNNNNPPENVTVSVIACYTPSTATTLVTTGTTPPTITGTGPTIAISSTTQVTPTGTGATPPSPGSTPVSTGTTQFVTGTATGTTVSPVTTTVQITGMSRSTSTVFVYSYHPDTSMR